MSRTILGTVKYFQPRTEGRGAHTVWFFALATFEGGELGRLIPIEIEGSRFVGMVRHGSIIEVKGGGKKAINLFESRKYTIGLGCKADRK